jgi:hypothetical protein
LSAPRGAAMASETTTTTGTRIAIGYQPIDALCAYEMMTHSRP